MRGVICLCLFDSYGHNSCDVINNGMVKIIMIAAMITIIGASAILIIVIQH